MTETLRMVNAERGRGLQLARCRSTNTRDTILHLKKAEGGRNLGDSRGESRDIMQERQDEEVLSLKNLHVSP